MEKEAALLIEGMARPAKARARAVQLVLAALMFALFWSLWHAHAFFDRAQVFHDR